MTAAASASTDGLAVRILLAIVVIVIATRMVGALFQRFQQPPVIGELIAGILLGPTLLGALPGDPTQALFPPDVRPLLSAMGNFGLVLFMFLVGLELDVAPLMRRKRAATTIALASVSVPFGLGMLLAAALHPAHANVGGTTVALLPFALFIGTAVSVTAFPVLARILIDAGIHRTQLGALALTCAAVEDALAWTMLAFVLAVVASDGLLDLSGVLAESILFAAAAVLVVRPLLRRLIARREGSAEATPGIVTLAIAGATLSACLTHMIGMHFVLGAFLFGAVFPRGSGLGADLDVKLAPVTMSALLPIFFVVPGLGVNLRGIGIGGLHELLLIVAVACAGKFLGATGAARGLGIRWREAAAIGTLMNTRGLMELIVLNVGVAAGILDQHLYGLFVVMAIVTTLMAGPILRALYRDRRVPEDLMAGDRARGGAAAWAPAAREAAETP